MAIIENGRPVIKPDKCPYHPHLIPCPIEVENGWLRQRNDELGRKVDELEKRVERLEAKTVRQREF